MTTPTHDSTVADLERDRHSKALVAASNRSKAADAVALDAREDFYRTLADAHGVPADGKLTYDEIAELTEWSRGWVRLAIGNYRKRPKANTT